MSATDKTKLLLANALKELTAKQHSFNDITVQMITDYCGISRRTFYNHFKTKQDLVDWIYEVEILRILQIPTRENWRENFRRTVTRMYENKLFYQNIFSAHNVDTHWGHKLSYCEYAFESVIKNYLGERRISSLHLRYLTCFFASGYVQALYRWTQNGMRESPDFLVEVVGNMVDLGLYGAIDRMLKTEGGQY